MVTRTTLVRPKDKFNERRELREPAVLRSEDEEVDGRSRSRWW
jgi:hypothetical protein